MNEREVENLRAAWAARPPVAPTPECSPPEAIWEAVAGKRPQSEVRDMLAHSIGCPDCSALWRLARELGDAEDGSPAAVPLRRAMPARWWVGAGALAAAAIVAFVLVPRVAPRQEHPVVRGSESPVRADPATATLDRAHAMLRWSGAADGRRFAVVVSTRDLTVLYRRSGLSVPELEIPVEALAKVPSGGEIVWRVEAIDPGGQHTTSEAFLSRVQ